MRVSPSQLRTFESYMDMVPQVVIEKDMSQALLKVREERAQLTHVAGGPRCLIC
jgi:hypothetical protein